MISNRREVPRAVVALGAMWLIACGSSPHIAPSKGAAPGTANPTTPAASASPPPSSSVATSGVDAGGGSVFGTSPDAGPNASACVQLIYLMGQDTGSAPEMSEPAVLYSFDPATLALVRIGAIPCLSASQAFGSASAASCVSPTSGGCTTAMAVDAQGVAVIFTPYAAGNASQSFVRVSTKDASCAGASATVSANNLEVVGAAFLETAATETLFVSLEDATSPSGVLTLGQLDPVTGIVTQVTSVPTTAAAPSTNPSWFLNGNMGADPAIGDLLLEAWPSNFPGVDAGPGTSPSLCYVDPCGDGSGCKSLPPDGMPLWVETQSETAAAASTWSQIWGLYEILGTSKQFVYDIYLFTPGWWTSGNRAVQQVNLISGMVSAPVALAVPDLGVNVFTATKGPQCPTVAVAPPPPPVM